ncbi:hypothetical protein GALMADRAFT_231588 [Galerina marginata CBS 339.88]|uniref:Uncharacterized protein n=1 Tax=Galerina marginata (strain CBS 339.88) TaxID=685588 RepID=A0A067SAP1_GALM3|nr:hypothetical protein GALMADRAFT_231588 [Galerina marginata CBS 339.88]
MTSSPTSSSSESLPKPTLPNFDPFAIHPFTNCSHVNQTPGVPSSPYPYAYGPTVGNYHNRHAPQGPPQTTNNASPSSMSRSPATPYGYSPRPAGVFVPFRKDTSSPELDDVLKSKKNSGKTTGNSDSRAKASSKV